ncbi:PREDICTED: WAT1-related protein At2g37460-like [Nicotiana attenuata]|nr:PREDICTED: WAT1-related protein At2g37460-like [Nicotiana attenuata]
MKLKSIRSQAKIIGTIAAVGGAMIMTLVHGPLLELWTKGKTNHESQSGGENPNSNHLIKGAILIISGCLSWAGFIILQAITLRTYPAELSLTAWICFLGTIEGVIVAMIMERGKSTVWAIHWDAKFLAIVYSGILCSGITYYIQGIVMKNKDPVFLTAFNPLSMVIVAVMSLFILREQMTLGRILGAIVIVVGLYIVLWGKSKDNSTDNRSPSTDEQLPTQEQAIGVAGLDINEEKKEEYGGEDTEMGRLGAPQQ